MIDLGLIAIILPHFLAKLSLAPKPMLMLKALCGLYTHHIAVSPSYICRHYTSVSTYLILAKCFLKEGEVTQCLNLEVILKFPLGTSTCLF